MKISYNWLKEYLDGELPPVDNVVTALTMHSFEIEGVEDRGGDKIMDVKILPNRAHDCLSHYGIASEIASVLNIKKKDLLPNISINKSTKIESLTLDTKLCSRAVMVYIKDIKVGSSPDWLKERLSLFGQKPINSVVDITNYLTLAFGQPTHAFDAGKIKQNKRGNFDMSVRQAKSGEKITLLNGKECSLDDSMIVITDKDRVLDVAGVMGGVDSGVGDSTTDIILSLSNFNPVSIRKTSKTIGVRTDASQRFENEISESLIDRVLPYAVSMLQDFSSGVVEGIVDTKSKDIPAKIIPVTADKISKILGLEIDSQTIIALLSRQGILAKEEGSGILVTIPKERLDLEIVENIAEEVGRLFGYDKISPKPLEGDFVPDINAENYVSKAVRHALIGVGFSEIYTYAFTNNGEMEIENPLAGDKKFLRKDLMSAMEASLEHNFKFLDLLGDKEVKLFEIGRVFKKDSESLHLSLGVKFPKSKKNHIEDEEIAKAIQAIEGLLGVSVGNVSIVGGMAEINLNKIIKEVSVPDKYIEEVSVFEGKQYKTISPYPFAVRDVAVFVPNEVSVEKVEELIKQHFNSNVVRFNMFDKFVKGDKTSYAFRLVFQSSDKTLTDEEINAVMNPIYETLKTQEGFEIR